jgi:hypothetical protein
MAKKSNATSVTMDLDVPANFTCGEDSKGSKKIHTKVCPIVKAYYTKMNLDSEDEFKSCKADDSRKCLKCKEL